jgi:uncharacterized delta-60 repeat protein
MNALLALTRDIRRPGSRSRAALRLEALEDRTVPSTLFDPAFNGSGVQVVPFDLGGPNRDIAQAVAIQADGKILVAGSADVGTQQKWFALVRFNTDGSLDSSFGSGGKETITFPGSSGLAIARALAIRSDGEILVAGDVPDSNGSSRFGVALLHTDGSLDSQFGTGGLATVTFSLAGGANALQIDSQGRIVLVGTIGTEVIPTFNATIAAARLKQDGTADSSFGTGGKVTVSVGAVNLSHGTGAIIQPADDKIVLVGSMFNAMSAFGPGLSEFVSVRLNSNDGSIDSSFGTDGTGIVHFGFNQGGYDQGQTIARQPDGKLVLAGSAGYMRAPHETRQSFSVFAVARLNPDGSFDPTFQENTGLAGRRVISLQQGGDHFGSAQGVGLLSNQDIILTGPQSRNMAAIRLRADGTLAAEGLAIFPNAFSTNNGMAIQSDGKIVLVGSADGPIPTGEHTDFAVARLTAIVSSSQTAGVFDPSTATWYLHNQNAEGVPDPPPFQYGGQGWVGLIGDWDGNATETIGGFDPSTATWYLRNDNSSGLPDAGVFQYGSPGWIPLAGDWTGSGSAQIGAFDPSTATWYLHAGVGAGYADAGIIQYGSPGWVPVVGDWTGTGHLGLGVFDPVHAVWYLRSSLSAGLPDVGVFQYGGSGWKPVVGDWTGSGHTGVGGFDPGSGTWYLHNTASAGLPDAGVFPYGPGVWQPVVGAYLGPSMPLLAPAAGPGADSLAAEGVQLAVSGALARLTAAGVDASLVQSLSRAHFRIGNLPSGTLGLAFPHAQEVLLSADGAGWGWFVDPTPLEDEEFANGIAQPGTAAAGHEDLLSVVLHEMGHLVGLPDQDGEAGGLMAEGLAPGIRRTLPWP